MPHSLRLLGGATLVGPAGPVAGVAAQRRRLALLALLAVARDATLSRDKAVAYLWPEADAERARHNLAVALHALRGALGERALVSSGDDLRLDRDLVACDVVDFEQALDRGALDHAVALYGGPFLDGVHLGADSAEFDRWADAERSRLAGRYASALERVADERAARGAPREAADAWRRLAALDPYSGRAALGLMRALERLGDRAGAIQHARVHTALLREDLEAEPDREVTALAEQLRGASSSPVPAAVLRGPAGPSAADGPAGQVLRALDERYAVGRVVDEGKVVTIYEARDTRGGHDVSLHVLNPRIAGIGGLDRFRRVLERVARLAESHVVPVSDVGAAGDALYYASPRTPGSLTLRERLQRERPLPVDEALGIARDVALALAHAHERDVHHGDLRPKHVVLAGGTAMLAGLGVVEALGASGGGGPGGTGVTIGAPAYLSPEQLTGEGTPDARSDVYGFGCVLYETLAGELPFGTDRFSSISRKLSQAAPSLRTIRESVPEALDQVVRKCLARTPADRYRTGSELRDALEGVARGT